MNAYAVKISSMTSVKFGPLYQIASGSNPGPSEVNYIELKIQQ